MLTPLSSVVVQLADAIGAAESLRDVYEAALAGLRDVTGIERASILLFDSDGVMRFKASAGLSDEYKSAVEGHTPWQPGIPPPAPVVVPDVQADSDLAAFRSVFEREGIRALAFIPVVSRRRVIGKFMLYRSHVDSFGSGELPAALALGYQIGFAVERMRADEQSEDARTRMLFALDAAQMGTWEWDLSANTVRWSDNLEGIHGLPPGSFTGEFTSYEREIHPDDRERVLASVQRALSEGVPHDVEYRIVAPDGTIRWVAGKGRVQRDRATGRPVRMTGVCMDIGTRKRAELELQESLAQEAALRDRLGRLTTGAERLLASATSERLFDEVLTLAHSIVSADAYAVWRRTDDVWQIVASRGLSDRFVAVRLRNESTRFDAPVIAEDVLSTSYLSVRRAEYEQEGIASLMSIPLRVGESTDGSMVFYHRSRRRVSELDLRVATALGQLAAAAMANVELHAKQDTLRQEAEAAKERAGFLAEASRLLSSLDYEGNLRLIAELAVPVLSDWCAVDLFDDRREIVRLAVAHTDPDRLPWAHEIHRKYPPRLDDPSGVGYVLRSGNPQLFSDIPDELLMATARDAEHLEIVRQLGLRSAMVVPLTAGRRTFGAITFVATSGTRRYTNADLDIAVELGRRAALAIENSRLYQEARDANRLKDEFLATLSHELRTPLNVILGRAARLADIADDREGVRRAGDTITRNAQTLSRLVEDLLDVSRFTVGQVTLDMREVDLGAIVASVISSLEPTARAKQIALRAEILGPLQKMNGDSTRLQQVVWNLVTNAIKFTPEGGTVRVSVRSSPSDVLVEVEDSGIGISAEFLPHVFETFRQAEPAGNRQHGGLGLGLSIVRRLVELHGGTVAASSAGQGCGAAFTIRLPAAPTPAML